MDYLIFHERKKSYKLLRQTRKRVQFFFLTKRLRRKNELNVNFYKKKQKKNKHYFNNYNDGYICGMFMCT